MKIPIVEIIWMDAQSLDLEPAMVRLEDVKNLNGVLCSIVGYLVDENKERYVIAKERWATGQYKYIHIIPKKSVLKVIKLKC